MALWPPGLEMKEKCGIPIPDPRMRMMGVTDPHPTHTFWDLSGLQPDQVCIACLSFIVIPDDQWCSALSCFFLAVWSPQLIPHLISDYYWPCALAPIPVSGLSSPHWMTGKEFYYYYHDRIPGSWQWRGNQMRLAGMLWWIVDICIVPCGLPRLLLLCQIKLKPTIESMLIPGLALFLCF